MFRVCAATLNMIGILVVFVCTSIASVPTQMTVQGRLTNSIGDPVPAGVKSFSFRIFNSQFGGTQIWPTVGQEFQSISTDSEGLWTARLGVVDTLTDVVFAEIERWLEITVDDGVDPAETLTRIKLNTSPYAYRISTVDGASGGNITGKVSIGPGHMNPGQRTFVAGENNAANGDWSTVPGGINNSANSVVSTVSGGSDNHATGEYSTIGGGFDNVLSGDFSHIGGGRGNRTSGRSTAVSSGENNFALDNYSTVAGGTQNVANDLSTTVCGGDNNAAYGNYSFVGGGFQNSTFGGGYSASIVGGAENRARSQYAFVGGGFQNFADLNHSVVCGGAFNRALGGEAFIGGGHHDTAGGNAVVGGGGYNTAIGLSSVIGGGGYNRASNWGNSILGGLGNVTDSFWSSIGGGAYNRAIGHYSTVTGGLSNQAKGDYSQAAGRRAIAPAGSFVWADTNDLDFPASGDPFLPSVLDNSLMARATGGIYFVTSVDLAGNAASGASLPAGSGSWSMLSDRNAKSEVAAVNSAQVLERVSRLQISEWHYTGQRESIRHIGPMAQDFRAAFGVGEDDRHISSVDADGVALAAIQELHRLNQRQAVQIEELSKQVAELSALIRK